jgi:hypothetical protein
VGKITVVCASDFKVIKSIELPIKGFVANDVNILFMTSQVAGLIFLESAFGLVTEHKLFGLELSAKKISEQVGLSYLDLSNSELSDINVLA